MKVNGWGYPPRGEAWRVACPRCEAALEFGEDEVVTLRFGRAKVCTIRCARCRRRIDLRAHRPEPAGTNGPTLDHAERLLEAKP